MAYDADLRLALELADVADAITMERFRSADLRVETKPDLTPVSEADRAVEEALRHRLDRERPDTAILGEEFGPGGDAATQWIIDPIDATRNYVRGIPVFATLIALRHEDEIVLGVVSAPALGHRWWATRGGGAFRDGARIQVSAVSRLEDAHLSINSFESFDAHGTGESILQLSRRCGRTRGFGDFWSHVLVADGSVDLAVEPIVAVWDLAPLLVIVEEAGGRFTDLTGERRVDGGSAIASNGRFHDEIVAHFG